MNLYIVDTEVNEGSQPELIEQTIDNFVLDFNQDSGFASRSSDNVYIYLTLEAAEEKIREVVNE
jgi:hypothetical protein